MRNAFARTLTTLAEQDSRVILLTGDLGFGVFDEYKKRFPGQYINVGISEQAMIDIAAGMALEGMRPVCYSIASFATGRCFEQIRLSLGAQRLPVIVVGAGGGYIYDNAGPTHHAIEDLGLMSLIPDMVVTNPGCPREIEKLLPQMLETGQPGYMRIGRYGETDYQTLGTTVLGKFELVRPHAYDCQTCIIATGDLAELAATVSDSIPDPQRPAVYECHTVKPLDTAMLGYIGNQFQTVVVVEEHSPHGGLHSQISAWYVQQARPPSPPRVLRCGVADELVTGNINRATIRQRQGFDFNALRWKVVNSCVALS